MEVAVAAITRPMDTDSIDVRGHCVELLMEIAHNCGVACLLPRLPALLQHLYGVVTEVNDLEYNSYIFPFISTVVREGLAAGAPVFATLEPQLQPLALLFILFVLLLQLLIVLSDILQLLVDRRVHLNDLPSVRATLGHFIPLFNQLRTQKTKPNSPTSFTSEI